MAAMVPVANLISPTALTLRLALLSSETTRTPAYNFFDAFAPGEHNHFPLPLCQEICRATGSTLDDETVKSVNREIATIVGWVCQYYCPMKSRAQSAKVILHSLLASFIETQVISLVMRLQEDVIREPSNGVLNIVACMHLMLLQELTTVDPEALAPSCSKYNPMIVHYACEYQRFTSSVYNRVLAMRNNTVTAPSYLSFVDKSGMTFYKVGFKDFALDHEHVEVMSTNEQSITDNLPNFMSSCEQARVQYIMDTDVRMHQAMNDPLGFLLSWSMLQEHPIPSSIPSG